MAVLFYPATTSISSGIDGYWGGCGGVSGKGVSCLCFCSILYFLFEVFIPLPDFKGSWSIPDTLGMEESVIRNFAFLL